MRTPREALAALLLVIIIAAPVVAYQPRRPDEPAFAPVPVPRASVADLRMGRGSAGLDVASPMPSMRRDWPLPTRPVVAIPTAPVIVVAIPHPSEQGGVGRHVSGVASRMGSGFGRSYLALPEGKGHRVRICGAAACWTMTSTDAGPDKAMQRAGRVADLNDWVWAKVSGLPLSRGLAKVSVTYL